MELLNTPYGLEEHLNAICQQAPQFGNLYSSWELNKRSCASALKQVAQNYPHYSVHDELHSQNVISNMEQVFGGRPHPQTLAYRYLDALTAGVSPRLWYAFTL